MPGHDPALLVQPAPAWLLCSVCGLVAKDAVQLICPGAHLVCLTCSVPANSAGVAVCTHCKLVLTPVPKGKETGYWDKYYPAVDARYWVGELGSTCPNAGAGCTWSGIVADRDKHYEQCIPGIRTPQTTPPRHSPPTTAPPRPTPFPFATSSDPLALANHAHRLAHLLARLDLADALAARAELAAHENALRATLTTHLRAGRIADWEWGLAAATAGKPGSVRARLTDGEAARLEEFRAGRLRTRGEMERAAREGRAELEEEWARLAAAGSGRGGRAAAVAPRRVGPEGHAYLAQPVSLAELARRNMELNRRAVVWEDDEDNASDAGQDDGASGGEAGAAEGDGRRVRRRLESVEPGWPSPAPSKIGGDTEMIDLTGWSPERSPEPVERVGAAQAEEDVAMGGEEEGAEDEHRRRAEQLLMADFGPEQVELN